MTFTPMVWMSFFYLIIPVCSATLHAQEPKDSLRYELQEVTVSTSAGNSSGQNLGDGLIKFNSAAVLQGSHILGEADIINAIKRSGNVSTIGDYGTGLSINGADPSQTIFLIDDVPLFFPYRFGGLFSVFQTPHFAGAIFERGIHDASFPNALGEKVNFQTRRNIPEKIRAYANVGFISSSLSLGIPAGRKFTLNIGGRISYINELYSKLFAGKTSQIMYNFYDTNVSAVYRPDESNTISIDAYYGADKLGYDDTNFTLDVNVLWKNLMTAAHWRIDKENFSAHNRIFYTAFNNRFNIGLNNLGLKLPSTISQGALAGEFNVYKPEIDAGYEMAYYSIKPQHINLQSESETTSSGPKIHQEAWLARLFIDKNFNPGKFFSVKAGLSGSVWRTKSSYTSASINPRVSLKAEVGKSTFNLHAGIYSQDIHQVGLSDIGLASNFFIGSDSIIPTQRALSTTLTWEWKPIKGYSIMIEPYYKLVKNQTEYQGQVLDMYDSMYSPEDHILVNRGHNMGINAAVYKTSGAITGSAAYSFGTTTRYSHEYTYNYRSINDPGHHFNLNADYSQTRKWTFSGSFMLSSGRVYTPIEVIYVIGKNLISEFGKRNSARFPLYHRLDLSATYSFQAQISRQKFSNHINLSIINAYGQKNVELQYFDINIETGDIYLRRVYSLFRFMPSISYSVEF